MAATPEKRVKQACTALLDKHKAYWFYPVMGGYGRSGIPDIVACHKGAFLAIECKAGFNKTTALQEREIAAIHKAGGAAMVVREDTLDLLEAWLIRSRHGA
jgi:hypothetical protein